MLVLQYLKRALLFVVKEIISFFIKFFLFLLIFIIFIGAIFSKYNQKPTIDIKDKSYVVLDLATKFNEKQINSNPFEENSLNFYSLLKAVENISYDDKIDGLILKLDGDTLSYAQSEELAQEISRLKANDKKVVAYFENVNRKNYYLASYATEIYMPSANSTNVNIYPYFTEDFYWKRLTDKLGVKFNVIHVGNYKSYMENLNNENMSKEAREDKTRIFEENYNNFLDIVSINRKIDRDNLNKIIQSGDLVAASSVDLLENKMIDKYFYWSDFENLIGKDKMVSIQEYADNSLIEENMDSSENIIYVIPLEGEIVDSQTEILSNNSEINVNETIDKLEKASKNKKIKGVVLRINSPGGSALTSDIIAKKVKELSEKKPVYVSMSGVAASGGYYISANANAIFVDRNTITGSIGVVSIMPDFSKLIKENGVNIESVSQGEYSDLYSANTFNEKKYNKIYNSNLKVYQDFLNVVSKGRKIDLGKLKTLAEGRVWTGEEAIKNGLADGIAGLNETIFTLADDNGWDNYAVVISKDNFNINNIYKKYSKYLKIDKKELIKEILFDNYLYNKPVTYLPYDLLD